MEVSNKITITVVTCWVDLLLLKRFINSVYKHWDLADIDKIIVVWNDNTRYRQEFISTIDDLRRSDVTIQTVWCEELWPQQDQWDWYSQQHLKLAIADLVNTDWYLIQDSKDFYIAKVSMSTFVKNSEQSNHLLRPITYQDQWLGVHGYHYHNYKDAYDLFELDYTQYEFALRTWQASVCPVHTKTIVEMNTHLKQQFGTLFPWILLLQRNHRTMFTEYALISAWHHKQGIMSTRYVTPDSDILDPYYARISSNKDLRRKKQDL